MIDISVIIVFRNEENYLVDCIRSIEEQFNGSQISWELLLVDGMSQDDGVNLAKAYLATKNYPWQIIENPKKILAAGWNLGIQASKGKYVVRPDAHATLHSGYILNGIKTLDDKKDITAVGGILETKAKGFWGNIIKVALSSKVGVGNSSFRTASKSDYADTAVYALYRIEIFEKVGFFNEYLVRHQDNDMHQRIKNAGGKFYMNVEMVADYYARDSVKKLLKQMFLIGYYLPDVMRGKAVGIRHLAPFLFYLVAIMGLLMNIFFSSIFGNLVLIQFGFYFLIILIDSILKSISQRNLALLLNFFIIPSMHFNYALGTFLGFIRILFSKKKS